MGLWWSRAPKCTQAVRAGKAATSGGKAGFALYRLADDQSEMRYQPGWQPQEAAPSSDPCELKVTGSCCSSDWAAVTLKRVVFGSGHSNQYCTAGQIS